MNMVPGRLLAIALLAHCVFAEPSKKSHVPPDSEIRRILVERIDKYRQSVGIVVGVIEPRGRRIVACGSLDQGDPRPLNGDTVFEIGSITKVFTSLLLADMVQRGEVALADPVAKYLPPEVRVPERGGRQITLQDLSTHTSGLPRDVSNLNPNRDLYNAYAGYSLEKFYEFVSTYQLTREIGSQFQYSSVGVALLGHALARRAGMGYEDLVKSRITEPLAMTSTRISLTPEMKAHLATGHDYMMAPVPHQDLGVIAPAGALLSTANDLLTFLAANLGYTDTPLAPAMAAMLKVRRATDVPSTENALGWEVLTHFNLILHSGATGGYRAFIGYDPKARVGVVVLSNGRTDAGTDDIGAHLLNSKYPLLSVKALTPTKERKEITVDPRLFDEYAGRYKFSRGAEMMTVTRDGDHLFIQASGTPDTTTLKVEVHPESNLDYFLKAADIQITFKVDSRGRATELILHQNGSDRLARRVE